jgi:AraC-like DNA-binding protein
VTIADLDWILSRPRIYYCEPAWKWNPVPFKDFDIWLVLDGRGRLDIAGESHSLASGRWFLLQPGDHFAASHDPTAPLVVFACHFATPDNRRFRASVITGVYPEPPHRDAQAAAKAWGEGPTGKLLAEALLRQMILHALHSSAREPSRLRDRIDSLAQEIRSAPGRKWEPSAIARRCGLSVPHLNRLWRTHHGMAPGRYVIHHRIRRAVELLRESDLAIQEIADALGYADVFFFHRQFRKFAGATPREVRMGTVCRFDDSREKL